MKRIQFGKIRSEWGTYRKGWRWYHKWCDFSVLPYLHFHFCRGNRCFHEPNKIGLMYGWLLWGGSVWISWPYETKEVEIAWNMKKIREKAGA